MGAICTTTSPSSNSTASSTSRGTLTYPLFACLTLLQSSLGNVASSAAGERTPSVGTDLTSTPSRRSTCQSSTTGTAKESCRGRDLVTSSLSTLALSVLEGRRAKTLAREMVVVLLSARWVDPGS